MSNVLVAMMWLTFMSVQFPDKELSPIQVISAVGILVAGLIADMVRVGRFISK